MFKHSHASIVAFVCFISFGGCGAEGEETMEREPEQENKEAVGQRVQAIGEHGVCTGQDHGGFRCLANCSRTNYWMNTGVTIYDRGANGHCREIATDFCTRFGFGYYQGACWGHL